MNIQLYGEVCHYHGSRWPWEKNGFENVHNFIVKIGIHGNGQIWPCQRIFQKISLCQTFDK